MITKLQAIVKKEIPIPKGFEGVTLKGHTVIEITKVMPSRFDYLRLSIPAETGSGFKNNTGMAEILTTFGGDPIEGFKTMIYGPRKYGYGYVNISKPFIKINVDRNKNEIKATIYKANIVDPDEYHSNLPMFNTTLLWKYDGDPDFVVLPDRYEQYQGALEAAISKTKCKYCHCLHFYQ